LSNKNLNLITAIRDVLVWRIPPKIKPLLSTQKPNEVHIFYSMEELYSRLEPDSVKVYGVLSSISILDKNPLTESTAAFKTCYMAELRCLHDYANTVQVIFTEE